MNADMRQSPRVFIIEQQPFDYTPATVYGELEFLEASQLAPHAPNAPDRWNNTVMDSIKHGLRNYVADYDYIVPTGSPSRMLVTGMVLSKLGKKHRILGWDARQKRYLTYIVNT